MQDYEIKLQELQEKYNNASFEDQGIIKCQIRAIEIAIEKRDKRILRENYGKNVEMNI